ncbi:MAG TPA: RelA/SpoT family protein, partial [Porphyromonadaceae bacterium]|nr:RelA/SpoT family protein [Porphyromonadaceae bacterium]
MTEITFADRPEFLRLYRRLYSFLRQAWEGEKVLQLKRMLQESLSKAEVNRDEALYDLLLEMRTALITLDEIGLKQPTVCAVLLFRPVVNNEYTLAEVKECFGSEVELILRGLKKVSEFTDKRSTVESENYMRLLLSMAEDIRVVFIMIARQLQLMRDAKGTERSQQLDLSVESTFLYAPLAHRLGLYTIKSELEDLCLKYTDRDSYDFIAQKLNETKRSRDQYIREFIEPVKERLDKTGLKYDIKGRTKSIHSILNKLKKQKIDFESIYDLFAIRVILDAPADQEKAQCWQVYSIITDMYQPNPK